MKNNFTCLPRPFLKWAGGKTQLTNALIDRMPHRFNTYHEPFVGSGAMFFRLARDGELKHAVLSDINAELIDAYIAIRDHVSQVASLLSEYPYTKEFYYDLREKDPWTLSLPQRAARLIYLNKTAYNGLYRVNRQGKFNVPFGKYKSPKIFDCDNLIAVSHILQEVEILCTPFHTLASRVKTGDWVYFDPPYIPLSSTANFTSYYPNGFSLAEQEQLRNMCIELTQKGVFFMLSNSDTPLVRELYAHPFFFIEEVLVNRAINCRGDKRTKITELVITNYNPKR